MVIRPMLMAAAVLAGVAAVGGYTGTMRPTGRDMDALSRYTQPVDTGRAVFEGRGNCMTCHGRGGTGTPLGPDLTDDVWLNTDGSLAGITAVIRTGVARPRSYPAPMPAMGGARLRDADVAAVARYVLGLRPPAPIP